MVEYYIHKKILKKHYQGLIKKLRFSNHYLMFEEQVLLYKSRNNKNYFVFHFRNDNFHNRIINRAKISKNEDKNMEFIRFLISFNSEIYIR